MNLTLINTDRITPAFLPEEISGKHWLEDTDAQGRTRRLASIEAHEGRKKKVSVELKTGKLEIILIENEHLGNYRYYVCPWGLIPVDLLPEGWGLLYYKNGKFYRQKESWKFRSNLKKENELITHAIRRYASGDSTGILINTYGGEK